MLSREECLAYLESAVNSPPAVPPLREWVSKNLDALSAVFDRADYLTIKHRGLMGVHTVLKRLGLIEHPDRTFDPLLLHQTHCDYCGAELFWALPGRTTRSEIVAYAELIGDEELKADQWIHPGVYCPNGCTFRMFNFASREG